jgi:phage protein D
MLTSVLGIRLQLLVGKQKPVPAPRDLMTALRRVEVTNQDSDQGDGFQMTFSLGKDASGEYGLLDGGVLDPFTRVIIAVVLNTVSEALIDGVITQHELAPGKEPGLSTLTVTGSDISMMLNLKQKERTYEGQSDSSIVQTIITTDYAKYGIKPDFGAAGQQPDPNERICVQDKKTDLAYIRGLAKAQGFSFYIEPVRIESNRAYFGTKDLSRDTRTPLTVGFGPSANTSSLSFTSDSLVAVTVEGVTLNPVTKKNEPISQPTAASEMAGTTAEAYRTEQMRDGANLDMAQAQQAAQALASKAGDPVAATGEVDTIRYGDVLRARRKVVVRGAGRAYDGEYYISRVTHQIEVATGKYTQSFQLKREGLGARRAVYPNE